ncbi:Putative platelet-activating factor acetylhydrolase, alpha/Beta hydrolase [Septoria linicola]|uniref:Putative phospholipase n=1 Tax=Septoria linicola TaxID=215465 RepID=A0A9Q9AK76_9PEZI|nr:putative platelet-activating factor acetylhydrolase, alpha/Beta hydrolase [Septoria linicola]USW47950.1 Putative platelet-activating factor acetylhydrolase, alpha/Beta hydrolase [Septoria linicola]
MLRLPPRPRWTTIRNLVCASTALFILVHLLLGMPVLSSRLPKYSGKFDVGILDVELPFEQQRNISDAVIKETGETAFRLETVLFTLYYPAVQHAVTQKPHRLWVEKPISSTAEGYARFAKVNNVATRNLFKMGLWLLASSTTIPAAVDAPLHGTANTYYEAEQPLDDYGLPRFPLLVLSHGVASSRNSYSQYCGEMAARGYIVASIEHRDGSGPGSLILSNNTTKTRFHFNQDSLEPPLDIAAFKAAQLSMRQAEVEETVRILKRINHGEGRAVHESNARAEGKYLAQWKERIMWDRIVIGGHSFGATLALQTLKEAPSDDLPFVGAICFDPGKHSGPLQEDVNVPMIIVHSQSWSASHSLFHGRPHFEVVKDIARKVIDDKKKMAWFVTSKGTSHASVTDAPLVEPFLLSLSTGSTISAKQGVLQYVQISQQLMNYLDTGHRQSILKEEITHATYDDANPRTAPPKIEKYWQIHMSPSAACPFAGYCGLDDTDDG